MKEPLDGSHVANGGRAVTILRRIPEMLQLERQQLHRRAQVMIAMILAYAPGFLLPFAVGLAAPGRASDALLLATATAVTVSSVVGLPYEVAWASVAADARARSGSISYHSLLLGVRQSLLVSSVVTILLMPAFSIAYFVGSQIDKQDLAVSLVCALLFPVAAGVGGVAGGILNAYGRIPTNLMLQGVRGLLAISSVGLVVAGLPVWTVALTFSLGECLRAVLSLLIARGCLDPRAVVAVDPPTARAIVHHVGGLSVLGLWPIIDRAFFAASPVGTVTRFEMADRIFFAATQVCNNLLVFPRVAVVAERMRKFSLAQVTGRELRVVIGASAVLAVLASAGLFVLIPFLPRSIHDSVPWAVVLLASLPAGIGGTVATRLAVASKNSWIIPLTSVIGVLVNLAGNVLGALAFGPFGVVLSTVVCRWLLLLLTAFLLSRRRSPAAAAPAIEVVA